MIARLRVLEAEVGQQQQQFWTLETQGFQFQPAQGHQTIAAHPHTHFTGFTAWVYGDLTLAIARWASTGGTDEPEPVLD